MIKDSIIINNSGISPLFKKHFCYSSDLGEKSKLEYDIISPCGMSHHIKNFCII